MRLAYSIGIKKCKKNKTKEKIMIRELDITELASTLENTQESFETANIWDVRDPSAYLAGHIVGAQNYPIKQGITAEQVQQTTGTIYVLCGGGSKAPKAAAEIDKIDGSRDIVILTGGTRKAQAVGMAIVSDL